MVMRLTGNLVKDFKVVGKEFILGIWKGMSPDTSQLRRSDGKKKKRKKKAV